MTPAQKAEALRLAKLAWPDTDGFVIHVYDEPPALTCLAPASSCEDRGGVQVWEHPRAAEGLLALLRVLAGEVE